MHVLHKTRFVRFLLLFLSLSAGIPVWAQGQDGKDFAVLAYNVENLFDVDGVAIFNDYRQDDPEDPFGYTRRKLLTKLQNTVAVLQTINAGCGPEVILFSELEADFTSDSTVGDSAAFLAEHRDTTVEAMLTTEWRDAYAGFPAEAWLMKAMDDAGMSGYAVVTSPSKDIDSGIAHTNAVFSKFPIVSARHHSLVAARDIIEVELDVGGHPLVLYANHWKSGASNPKLEPTRVQNATVLRRLMDARLAEDPYVDIIIGGDLNSHYNHSNLYPGIETGINDVLGSQGDELAIQNPDGPSLYNLWFELPPEDRYTEVWRGRRGTLMHLLITRGLYDRSGVGYVDGSFEVVLVPGLNVDALGRPLSWTFAGETGGGVSDHLPVMARFEIRDGASGEFLETVDPSLGDDAPSIEIPLGFSPDLKLDLSDGGFLSGISEDEIGPYVGRLFRVEATIVNPRPLTIRVADVDWPAYAPNPAVYKELAQLKGTGVQTLVVRPGIWKGRRQLVIEGILAGAQP